MADLCLLSLLKTMPTPSISSLSTASQMWQDLVGAPMIPATVQKALLKADKPLVGFSEAVEQQILEAPPAHADETGIRVASSLGWLHTLSTPTLTLYGVHAKRGVAALSDFGLLPRFRGRLIDRRQNLQIQK